jgi:hypothetical protein
MADTAAAPAPELLTRPAALDVLTKQNALIAQLWGMYVTATFAAAVFNLRPGASDWRVSTAITVGFLTFALGHWSLLLQAVRVSRAIAADLGQMPEAGTGPLSGSIRALLQTVNPPAVSAICHLLIDTCVVVSIWAKG